MTPPQVHLRDFPVFHRPLPVDHVFAGPFHHGHAIGPQARAHVGVLRDTGRDFALLGYQRGPWAVVKSQLRSALMRTILPGAAAAVTYKDQSGTDRTVNMAGEGAANVFNTPGSDPRTAFKYGSGSTAPAATDFDIQTIMGAIFDGTSYATDAGAQAKRTVSGSRLHTEAGGTIREVAHFARWQGSTGLTHNFLLDHSAISALAVATDQTVSITYEWTYG